jgi:5-methylcytosine-specific restriction endonuclease McrA
MNRRIVLAAATHCARCGKPEMPDDPLTAGHIVAVIDGGSSRLDNLQAEHASCNSRAGAERGNNGSPLTRGYHR